MRTFLNSNMQQQRERSMLRVSLDHQQQNSKRMLIADAATRDQLSQISCADSEERRFQINLPAAISERCSAKTLKDIRILQSHKMRLQTKARTRAPGPEISAADSAARSSAAAAADLYPSPLYGDCQRSHLTPGVILAANGTRTGKEIHQP